METESRHVKQELENWLKKISYIQLQNVFLKDSLSSTIKHDVTPAMLDHLEFFQNQFLNKDTILTLLRYDIATQNKLLENGKMEVALQKQNMLRADIEKLEKEFDTLTKQFNAYLDSIQFPPAVPGN